MREARSRGGEPAARTPIERDAPDGVTAGQDTVTPSGGLDMSGSRYPTRPYQTLLVQIFCSRTTSPVFGACQSLPFPA